MPKQTPTLPVDENLMTLLAEAIDWMTSNTTLDPEQSKDLSKLQDWALENYPEIANDYWYFADSKEHA